MEGMLCLAHSEDGCIYRARVVTNKQAGGAGGGRLRVEFFDFGNMEVVERVVEYPACLGLELAPAAAKVVLARPPAARGPERQPVLEACLLGDEGDRRLQLQLEKDETSVQVARLYENGEEVLFDNKIKAAMVFEKSVEQHYEEEDVVVESEMMKKYEEASLAKPSPIDEETEGAVPMVPGPALPRDGVQQVVVVLVESVARVWVQRKEDEAKVGRMMAALASMTARLAPVRRPPVGCVYGAKFTEDDVMYRAVVEGEVPDGGIIVRFIDFGNAERKETSELVHLSEKMARFPAAAHELTLEENTAAEDSQDNRDCVETTLEGDLELLFKHGKCAAVKSAGKTLEFSFNKKVEVVAEKGRKSAATIEQIVTPVQTGTNSVGITEEGTEKMNLSERLESKKPKLETKSAVPKPKEAEGKGRARHSAQPTYTPPALTRRRAAAVLEGMGGGRQQAGHRGGGAEVHAGEGAAAGDRAGPAEGGRGEAAEPRTLRQHQGQRLVGEERGGGAAGRSAGAGGRRAAEARGLEGWSRRAAGAGGQRSAGAGRQVHARQLCGRPRGASHRSQRGGGHRPQHGGGPGEPGAAPGPRPALRLRAAHRPGD